jgi:hypothetical protein
VCVRHIINVAVGQWIFFYISRTRRRETFCTLEKSMADNMYRIFNDCHRCRWAQSGNLLEFHNAWTWSAFFMCSIGDLKSLPAWKAAGCMFFYREWKNLIHSLSNGGQTCLFFSSILVILPTCNMKLFFSLNIDHARKLGGISGCFTMDIIKINFHKEFGFLLEFLFLLIGFTSLKYFWNDPQL